MNKVLDILDSMEEIRQKAAENPEQYPIDHTIRLCSAIVAQAYGYQKIGSIYIASRIHNELA